MDRNAKIYIAGHCGLVGSALVRRLQSGGYNNLIMRGHAELDLTNQQAVQQFYAAENPDYVFVAAAKVGGIHANNAYPADFIYHNLMIECNLIHGAYQQGGEKTLIPGLYLHLPETRTAAHERRISLDRVVRADQ